MFNRRTRKAWIKGNLDRHAYLVECHLWRTRRRDDANLSRHRGWQSERD